MRTSTSKWLRVMYRQAVNKTKGEKIMTKREFRKIKQAYNTVPRKYRHTFSLI